MNKILKLIAGGTTAMLLGAGLVLSWTGADVEQDQATVTADAGKREMAIVYEEIERLRAELAELRNDATHVLPAVTGDEYLQLLVELQQNVAMLSRDMAALAVDRANPNDVPAIEEAPVTGFNDEMLQIEQAEMLKAQRMAAMDTYYASETEYTEWSSRTTEAIRDAFSSEQLAGVSAGDVSCRETLCRVEVHSSDRMNIEEMEMQLPFLVGDQLPRATMQQTEHADGSVSVVMFLAREGHAFPGS